MPDYDRDPRSAIDLLGCDERGMLALEIGDDVQVRHVIDRSQDRRVAHDASLYPRCVEKSVFVVSKEVYTPHRVV